jgi:hypothetical protein
MNETTPATVAGQVERRVSFHALLEHSFETVKGYLECPPETRLAYLSEHIFNFTTYDGEKDEFFGRKAVEVCAAINDGKTFDFIKDADNYTWFLVMCNMPFFAERLEWGTSIRGAWWAGRPGKPIEFYSCGLWIGDEQLIDTLQFSTDEWKRFIAAVIEFAAPEMKANGKEISGPAARDSRSPAEPRGGSAATTG